MYSFNEKIADEVGMVGAVILDRIYLRSVKRSMNKEAYTHDGRQWMYLSLDDFAKEIPWVSKSTIIRELKSMQDKGFVDVGNYNKRVFDKTKWYTPSAKALSCYSDEHKEKEAQKPVVNADKKPKQETVEVGIAEAKSAFNKFWSCWPVSDRNKDRAEKAYYALLQTGTDPDTIIDGLRKAAAFDARWMMRDYPLCYNWLKNREWERL